MKHTSLAHRLSGPFAACLFAFLLLGPSLVRAAECPASSPEDPQERRRLAKDWFNAAQQSEDSGDYAEATRAYACSYKMVAHPNTAFNLGRVAERSGDNDLALKMFKAYLTLKPDAADKDEVKARVKALEEKMAAAESAPPASAPVTGTENTPPAAADNSAEGPGDAVAPPPETPPPAPPTVARQPEPEPEAPPSRKLEWVIGGASAAVLLGGVVFNLAARSKMSNCQNDAAVTDGHQNPTRLGTASDECNAARPLAYTSYVMFGVAAAGAVTDALLLILRGSSSSGSSSGPTDDTPPPVGLLPLQGGGGLVARGRF